MSRALLLALLGALGGLYGCPEDGRPARPAGPAAPFRPPLAVSLDAAVGPSDAGVAILASSDAALPADFAALPLALSEASDLLPYDAPVPQPFSPVLSAPRALPPLSGGTLAAGTDGTVVASDPDRDQIYVIDATLSHVDTLSLATGQEPGRVAIHGQNAYVALRAGGALLTVDLTRPRIRASLAVCAAPRGVAFDAIDARVLVACAGGDVVAVSADGARVLARAQVAPDLRDIGRDAQGVWVSQYRSARLLRLDAELRVSAQQEGSSAQLGPPLPGPVRPFTPTLAWRTIESPSGDPFMLHQRAQASAVGSSTKAVASIYGAAAPGNESFCESGVVHSTFSRFGAAAVEAQRVLPQAVVPVDLSFSPDNQWLAVVAPGNFARQDLRGPGGVAPQQLYLVQPASLRQSDWLGQQLQETECLQTAAGWAQHFPGEATAVQFLDDQRLVVQVRNPAELDILRLDDEGSLHLLGVLSLSSLGLRDTGHEVFHQNTGAGIACASCHGEGLDDGHVWSFADLGLRRTQHLRGGVLQSAPFHWSGDLASFDALLSDVYVKRMGGTDLAQEARATLSRWLDAVPAVPSEPGDAERVARGRALFESPELGCAACHAGPRLRSDGRHDVGTGGSFEVPSLRGLSLRLPLMHDGCADTLAKRFDPACGGSQHGQTDQLGEPQLGDLIAYLASL